MLEKLKSGIVAILSSGSQDNERPKINKNHESNIPNLYIIGDLAGAPVIKLAMEQGYNVVNHIVSLPEAKGGDTTVYDLIVVGAGAAGLNAALTAKDKGLSCLVIEKSKIANTIEDFPEGKWVYAEPDEMPAKGKLWLDGATKEDLIKRWHQIIQTNELDVRVSEPLNGLTRSNSTFDVKTSKSTYKAKRIVLATGQRGNPRKLNVSGEGREKVYHQLYSPKKYHDEKILVVGGGNSAVEAAIVLCERNKVYLSYRKSQFERLFKDNQQLLNKKIADGQIEVIFNSNVTEFAENEAHLKISQGKQEESLFLPYDHAFVLIGSDIPKRFLKSLGIKMENEWEGSLLRSIGLVILTLFGLSYFGKSGNDLYQWAAFGAFLPLAGLIYFGVKGDRFAWLGVSFLVCYTIYGAKLGKGMEFWPYTNWGYEALSFSDRPASFWYTVMYSTIMTLFGIQAIKRWGFDHKDNFQIWRYISLLGFQWVFFFIIPEFLFQWLVQYEWIKDLGPTFTDQAWRAYGIVYAWPLFFYTFFYNPHDIWIVWGVFLTLLIIPIFTIWHGKRYCSWICGCGGLAETLGDRWRHLAPKGKTAVQWEWMNWVVLIFAFIATLFMLSKDAIALFTEPAELSVGVYRVLADIWLVGILPVTLYPFLGGKVWCRYWCPLAKWMQLTSKLSSKLGFGKFKITSNHKCIACNECSRYCQIGINVMSYSLKQEVLDNSNSSCIGCGICVTVCPMDVLSFGDELKGKSKKQPEMRESQKLESISQ